MCPLKVGDNPKSEAAVLKDLSGSMGNSRFVAVAWSQHPAGDYAGIPLGPCLVIDVAPLCPIVAHWDLQWAIN